MSNGQGIKIDQISHRKDKSAEVGSSGKRLWKKIYQNHGMFQPMNLNHLMNHQRNWDLNKTMLFLLEIILYLHELALEGFVMLKILQFLDEETTW